MLNKKIMQMFLIVLLGIAIMLFPCVVFTSCLEEKQLEDLVQQTDQEETEPETEELVVALPGLPGDVAGYEKWLKINNEPIPPVPGGDPHNGTKNVYVNQSQDTIAPDGEQQFPYPDGSIVVKEAYRPDKDYVGLIAIMRKIAGSNPDHNDWEFIEYTRGKQDDDFKVIASGGLCSNCHVQAEDTDYVFTELE